MKYVVKNCDNFSNFWTCRSTIQNRKGCYCCKDITDCLLKQIVEKCKMNMSDISFRIILKRKNERGLWLPASTEALLNILQLLEIEEVNE